ncbi:hypothetical protein ACA910_021039 [Epithemia clementina (nom. ined.)]
MASSSFNHSKHSSSMQQYHEQQKRQDQEEHHNHWQPIFNGFRGTHHPPASRFTTNKWVRSAASNNGGNEALTPTDISEIDDRGITGSSVESFTASKAHRPILKGPAPRMSWTRPRPHTDKNENNNRKAAVSLAGCAANPNKTWRREPSSLVTAEPSKIVLITDANAKKSFTEESVHGRPTPKGQTANSHRSGEVKTGVASDCSAKSNKLASYNASLSSTGHQSQWTRIGSNKLVQSKSLMKRMVAKETPDCKNTPKESAVNGEMNPSSDSINSSKTHLTHKSIENINGVPGGSVHHAVTKDGLKRVGHNKLVGVSSHLKQMQVTTQVTTQLKRKTDMASRNPNLRYAKRIRIATGTASGTTLKDGDPLSSDETPAETSEVQQKGEKDDHVLTTFAYCQPVSSGGKRSHPAIRKRRLVRVPATDTVRICPFFAKGMECTNEACLLRHDVPPEAAQPTCYYFLQQNGMCLKENCPFRHVKSGKTEPCPRFMQTGYCISDNCMLAHVQHKNKTFSASGNSRNAKKSVTPLVFYD